MFRRKKKAATELGLPFTRESYDHAVHGFTTYIEDVAEDSLDGDDLAAVSLLERFLVEGLPTFDELLTDTRTGTVEPDIAFAVTRVLAPVTLEMAGDDTSGLPEVVAARAAEEVSRRVPIARGSRDFAVNRAERVVLEGACATFLQLELLDLRDAGEPFPRTEEHAQCVGVLLMWWLAWNRPYAFAAFKGEDLLPPQAYEPESLTRTS